MDEQTEQTGQAQQPRRAPRRTFLRLSLGAATAVPLALLAACGAQTTTGATGTSASTGAAETSSSGVASTGAATTAAAGTGVGSSSSAAMSSASAGAGSTSSAAAASASSVSSSVSAAASTAAGSAAPVAGGAGRGKDGTLKILFWQAVTILNPHLATGTKDAYASRLVLEPLFTATLDGKIQPVLAADVPTQQNGGLSADGTTATVKLKPGVTWSDGEPLTADDVVFTWQYVTNPATAATSLGYFNTVSKMEAVDQLTVKATFKGPNPSWFSPWLGFNGCVLPKHVLQTFVGANAHNAPFNSKPIGTGPYKVDSFTPGDLVVYSINDRYRDPNKPAFAQVQLKGGGDAPSAARAVFETGEYHYAWNLQVEWPVLQQIMQGGKGDLVTALGGGVEQLYFNQSDPNATVDGERSKLGTPHPILSDAKVRQAIAIACNRDVMAKQLYGDTGDPTVDVLTVPTNMKSTTVSIPFDIAKANQLLDQAGWVKGGNGIRAKNGMPLHLVLQTSVNSLRQKEQAVIKQGAGQIGVDLELKQVSADLFFGGAAGDNDNINHFYADMEMFTATYTSPVPISYMRRWSSVDPAVDVAQKSNEWQGSNYSRWVSPDYNKLYTQAQTAMDPQKLADTLKQMNDLVVGSFITVGLVDRRLADAKAKWLDGPNLAMFDANTWNIADWTKKG